MWDESQSSRYQSSRPDSAVAFAYRGLKLAQRLKNKAAENNFLSRLALINAEYGNLALAIKFQQQVLSGFRSSGDHRQITNASSCLGILEARAGNIHNGKQLIQHSLQECRSVNDTAGMISAYTRLGEVAELSGQPAQALQNYQLAEKLHEGRPLSDAYFELIHHIGQVHGRLGNPTAAAAYYEKGAAKSVDRSYLKAHIAFLNKAGIAWTELGDKDKALAFHRQGLENARNNGLREEEARSLMGIASALKKDDAAESISHLQKALEIAKAIGHKQLSSEIYHSLSDVYRQQFRYQEALQTLDAHHRLLDSLMKASEGHKIAVLQSSYELAEAKLKVEALQLSNERKTNQRNEGLIAIAGVLIVLLIVAFYFYRTRRLNRELQNSNLIKDKLFSIIGHDLRNPIGGITQMLAVMQEGGLTEPEIRNIVEAMKKQGDVTLEILNALLNWGEAQLRGIHVNNARFAARDNIQKNIIALGGQAAEKSININNQVRIDLNVSGDLNHFDFIIRNLLSNAIKFSPRGEQVDISATLHANEHRAVFAVKDMGKGISAAQQQKFLSSGMDISYGTKGEKGTGIGLLLSKEFVKANHGRIWLESSEGKGTIFFFSFPLASPREA